MASFYDMTANMTVDAPNRIDFATCGHDGHGNCAATTNALQAEGRQNRRHGQPAEKYGYTGRAWLDHLMEQEV
eukprot:gene7855-5649_t